MKTPLLTLLAACLVSAASPAFAQDKDKGGDRQQARLDKMAENLTLTDGQKTQVAAVFDQYKPQLDALRADTTLTREEKFAKMQGIQKEISDRITPILTPEQQAKYAEMKSKRPGGPGGPDGKGGPGGPGGKKDWKQKDGQQKSGN